MGLLSMVRHAGLHETMAFIERESIHGMGCGLVDLAMLASALMTLMTPGASLWTLDKRLADLAQRNGVAHKVAAR